MSNQTDEGELYGVFKQEDVKRLHSEWLGHRNPFKSFRDIATPLLRHYNLRRYDEIVVCDAETQKIHDDIFTAFLDIQSNVLTFKTTKTVTRSHKKGDFIRDANNEPIPTDDGRGYKTYTKDVLEKAQIEEDRPLYDYCLKSSSNIAEYLRKKLCECDVLPDYDALRSKYEAGTDLKEAFGIISRLLDFYEFDKPKDTFIQRFALFISNAKAKALGYQPKWGVLLALVGGMGVGKGWLSRMIASTYDESFGCRSQTTSYDRILGEFNPQMGIRGMLLIDEASGLDKTNQERLKHYITEPTVYVNPKGLPQREVPNLVSFISSTNDPVLQCLCGLDKNRRICEFTVVSKKAEVPEEKLRDWLMRLWEVIPCRLPNENRLEKILESESKTVLDVDMEDVVFDIFNEDGFGESIFAGQRINTHKLKRRCSSMKVQYEKVRKWCVEQGLIYRAPDGHTCYRKHDVDEFLNRVRDSRETVCDVEEC